MFCILHKVLARARTRREPDFFRRAQMRLQQQVLHGENGPTPHHVDMMILYPVELQTLHLAFIEEYREALTRVVISERPPRLSTTSTTTESSLEQGTAWSEKKKKTSASSSDGQENGKDYEEQEESKKINEHDVEQKLNTRKVKDENRYYTVRAARDPAEYLNHSKKRT